MRVASFKNISFQVTSRDVEGGRRGQNYEYPHSDAPAFSDLGSKIKRITVSGFFVGTAHLSDWGTLQAKLDSKTPGILIVPWGDRYQYAVCKTYRVTNNINKQNSTSFDLTFIDAGAPQNPQSFSDSSAALDSALQNQFNAIDALLQSLVTNNGQALRDVLQQTTNIAGDDVTVIDDIIGVLTKINTGNLQLPSITTLPMLRYNTDLVHVINNNRTLLSTANNMGQLYQTATKIRHTNFASRQKAQKFAKQFQQRAQDILYTIPSNAPRNATRDMVQSALAFLNEKSIQLPSEKAYSHHAPVPALVMANIISNDKSKILEHASHIGGNNPQHLRMATWLV